VILQQAIPAADKQETEPTIRLKQEDIPPPFDQEQQLLAERFLRTLAGEAAPANESPGQTSLPVAIKASEERPELAVFWGSVDRLGRVGNCGELALGDLGKGEYESSGHQTRTART
jgi:hypothetical protein